MNRRCEYDGVSDEKRIYVMGNIGRNPREHKYGNISFAEQEAGGPPNPPYYFFTILIM